MKAVTDPRLTQLSAVVRKSLFALVLFNQVSSSRMPRRTVHHEIPSDFIGTKRTIQAHHFGPKNSLTRCAYIQASLHADELPGIQVSRMRDMKVSCSDSISAAHVDTIRSHVFPRRNACRSSSDTPP